ncbi:XRE family transcriptional regulator [Agrobacterium sp. MS2]|uniref:XRE family transcriptional regulator n=1 Tax=Agrobacterium sp. MS2 TaxID=1345498 RepID=UPI000DBF49D3|nr:XRE family transcriptional regulator [Agrobacterium sp. MS2]RAL98693.1 hypothetical protein DOU54_06440 [Agrobacterium sp. MS2]
MDIEEQKKSAAERIKAFRESLGLDQEEFAEFLEMGEGGQSTISKWERAKQLPGSKYTSRLAQKSGKSTVYFSGLAPVDQDGIDDAQAFPLIGEIQAGVWREAMPFDEHEAPLVSLPYAANVAPYKMRAFLVRGTSMDELYPDGSIVFVAGLHDNPISPVDGDVVVVQRQDEAGLYEATLKELVIDENGRKWLWPRSFDPEHQSPLSINHKRDKSTDVVILGIVQAAIVKPRRSRRR